MITGSGTNDLLATLTALKGSPLLAPYSLAVARRRCRCEGSLGRKEAPGEQADPRLAAVAEALEELDQAKTVADTLAVCSRTILDQFEVARLALALPDEEGGGYLVTCAGELQGEVGIIPAEMVKTFLPRSKVKKMVPFDARMCELFPGLQATRYCYFPLQSQDQLLGFFLILDCDPGKGELMLLSMVAQATAARLSRIVRDAEQAKLSARSDRLMALTNTLLLVDDKEELYGSILSIACELVDAMQGSIMLLDSRSQEMEIAFTRGLSLNSEQSLPVKVGKGIAGMVAQTGEALLVNDVEKDARTAMQNRPRFKSKSLISIPLKLKEKVTGVLNISDRKNAAPFSNADLHLLSTFASLASVMIERTSVLEKSIKFEQLSVTDSLTGLYNRRFLKSRLEEELNRSTHQGLSLTLLFIDLDFFKSYNDVCGHLAGDKALKRIADIIKASVREMDVVARYGGEEFCAVLPGTTKEEALLVAERIRAEIEAEPFACTSEPATTQITASLGVASFPEDGLTFTALVHASDMALYQAKAGGRNRIVAARAPLVQFHPVQPSSDHDGSSAIPALSLSGFLEG